jgi:predicted DNA-binding antitoxin AbrB/MazE fold protein
MTLTVEAIYEDGVLKPAQPLPLREHEQVLCVAARRSPAIIFSR